jgi:hypothetical protein
VIVNCASAPFSVYNQSTTSDTQKHWNSSHTFLDSGGKNELRIEPYIYLLHLYIPLDSLDKKKEKPHSRLQIKDPD